MGPGAAADQTASAGDRMSYLFGVRLPDRVAEAD